MPLISASRGVPVILQNAATTGNGTVACIPVNYDNPRVEFEGAGTIGGGTVLLEENSNPTYSGTWSLLFTLTASTLTGGAKQVVHILGNEGVVRARISSNITGGGTISAVLYAG